MIISIMRKGVPLVNRELDIWELGTVFVQESKIKQNAAFTTFETLQL